MDELGRTAPLAGWGKHVDRHGSRGRDAAIFREAIGPALEGRPLAGIASERRRWENLAPPEDSLRTPGRRLRTDRIGLGGQALVRERLGRNVSGRDLHVLRYRQDLDRP